MIGSRTAWADAAGAPPAGTVAAAIAIAEVSAETLIQVPNPGAALPLTAISAEISMSGP